jgi:hypothetical protein
MMQETAATTQPQARTPIVDQLAFANSLKEISLSSYSKIVG